MTSKIFTLQDPRCADIYIIKEDAFTTGIIGVLNIFTKNDSLIIEGKTLVPAHIAHKMCDLVSRKPKGLFDLRFLTTESRIDVRRITGNKYSEFWMDGEEMAWVFFSQKGIKATNIPEPGKDFITCPTRPGAYPSLGDLYYDEAKKMVRMYMTHGWTNTNIILPAAPNIEATTQMAIPDFHASFLCQPLEHRKWDRIIGKGRAAKVLQASRKKHG